MKTSLKRPLKSKLKRNFCLFHSCPSLWDNQDMDFCRQLFIWIFLGFYFLTGPALAIPNHSLSESSESGEFSGRISHTNSDAGLLRLKVDFDNVKYLNRKDRVELWDEGRLNAKCSAYVVGKSNNYLLLRAPQYRQCERTLKLPAGTYMRAYSQDLANNIKMGEELIGVLLKKRTALHGKLSREKQKIETYADKVEVVNNRYELLRQKLMTEWQKELGDLEEDQTAHLRNFENIKTRLDQVDKKLERYHIEDKNLETDRWALDPKLYTEK